MKTIVLSILAVVMLTVVMNAQTLDEYENTAGKFSLEDLQKMELLSRTQANIELHLFYKNQNAIAGEMSKLITVAKIAAPKVMRLIVKEETKNDPPEAQAFSEDALKMFEYVLTSDKVSRPRINQYVDALIKGYVQITKQEAKATNVKYDYYVLQFSKKNMSLLKEVKCNTQMTAYDRIHSIRGLDDTFDYKFNRLETKEYIYQITRKARK